MENTVIQLQPLQWLPTPMQLGNARQIGLSSNAFYCASPTCNKLLGCRIYLMCVTVSSISLLETKNIALRKQVHQNYAPQYRKCTNHHGGISVTFQLLNYRIAFDEAFQRGSLTLEKERNKKLYAPAVLCTGQQVCCV